MIRKPKKIIKKLKNYRTIKVLGVKVDFVNLEKTLSLVEKWINPPNQRVNPNKQYQITTPNPEHIVLAQDDYRFKKIINNSSLSIPDGIGLVWAAELLGSKKDHPCGCKDGPLLKLSGIDLMQALCKLAAQKNWRVFLLGAKKDTVRKVAKTINNETMGQCSNELKIAYDEGSKNIINETTKERQRVIRKINKFKPHLLFVAYGAPMQEKWIAKNISQLNVKVAMGVGGAFDYLAREVKRAPKWMQNIGLEWFWRLVCEPWRIFRQLRLLKFVGLVVKEMLIK